MQRARCVTGSCYYSMHTIYFWLLCSGLVPAPSTATPDSLTPREAHNLTALAQAAGAVKYFYPNRHTARLSWETMLVRSIPVVRRARTDAALAATLDSALRLVAPETRLVANARPVPVVAQPLVAGSYYHWEHQGLGLDKAGLPIVRVMFRLAGLPYASSMPQVSAAAAEQRYPGSVRQYSAMLTDSISLCFPLVLSAAQHRQRLPWRSGSRVRRLEPEHMAQRLATIMLTWNIIQHFYPYRALLDSARWSAHALPAALHQAARARTQADLLRTCRQLLARLPDRHVRISPKTRTGLSIVPPPWALRFTLVDSLVVVRQSPAALRPLLAPGTIVTHVDGQPVRQLIHQLASTIPATSGAVARHLAAEALVGHLAARAPTSLFTVRATEGPVWQQVVAFREVRGSLYHQLPAVREVEPGLYYLDAARLRYSDFQQAMSRLQKARGVVVDMRQRPTYDMLRILPHFSATALRPDSTATPRLRQPNFQQAFLQGATGRPIPAQQPYLQAPTIFLVGPDTYSYGETLAELVRRHRLGLLVGQRTGGTNGEMNMASVGRSYHLSWTGRQLIPRGDAYQGSGLAPDLWATPTLAQLTQEQDAELLLALTWLRQHAR